MNFNDRFRQVVFFIVLAGLAILIFIQAKSTIPGILSAITLYLLNRVWFLKLIHRHKWNKTLTVIFFITIDTLVLFIPFLLTSVFIFPKLVYLTNNANELFQGVQKLLEQLQNRFDIQIATKENLMALPKYISGVLPNVFSSAAGMITNLGIMYFTLYYMLQNAEQMEKKLTEFLPLRKENTKQLAKETKDIVISYSIGIPVLALAQGICATIGYAVFGISDPLLLGFLTGLCSVIPFVGSALVWVPLVVYLFAVGPQSAAIGLLAYCLIVVLNVDNILRMVLLKAFADIHPLITLFGVIVGLPLFGFLGLIFGPLLISYLLLLMKIYVNEFSNQN
ncbi:MAG TPA: AI-2E family transporter [Chitinophagales bacterium]|nr:AI-2E family transporter [Chitinophagales bacterium]HNL84095.1 AI-2E family transporter [Chitinophagales bacterium]